MRRSWFYHFVRILALAESAFYAAVMIDMLLHPNVPDVGMNPIAIRYINALVEAPLIYAIGLLILRRTKGNLIGWLLVVWAGAIGTGSMGVDAFGGYAPEINLVTSGVWPILWAIPIHFPDGEPYPRRPGWVAQGVVAGFIVLIILAAFGTPLLDSTTPLRAGTPNRFYVPLLNPLAMLLGPINYVPVLMLIVLVVLSVTLRFRASHSRERQQLKYMLFSAALLIVVVVVSASLDIFSTSPSALTGWQAVLGYALNLVIPLIPVVGIALPILRHKLYDIDIIIRRTLVYVPLTALLAGVYAASTALLQKLFTTLTSERSDAGTVLTTLIVVAAFDPVKRGVESLVGRWFKAEPDPARTLKGFVEQVQAELGVLDPQRTSRRLLEEAVKAFGAKGGAVWLGDVPQPTHTAGHWDGRAILRAPLETPWSKLGVLILNERNRGGYSAQDQAILQEYVAAVALALSPPLPAATPLPPSELAGGEMVTPAKHVGMRISNEKLSAPLQTSVLITGIAGTLVIAALALPFRSHIQSIVNRHFFHRM
jgi:hypothetical protein